MKTSTKRLLRAGFAAAVLAVAAWAAAAQARQSSPPAEKPGPESRSLRREMARDLFNITPEQEKKLREFRERGRKDRQAYRDEMLKLRGELRDRMKDPQADAAKIDALIDKRARLRADGEKQALRRRAEREKIFTPEQLEKMKKYRGLLRGHDRAGAGRDGRMRPAARRWRHPSDAWIWY